MVGAPGDDDVDGVLQAIGETLHPSDNDRGGPPVTVPARALAAAVVDRNNTVAACDPHFAEGFDLRDVADAVSGWRRGPRSPALACLNARDGAASGLLLGAGADARGWPLSEAMRRVLDRAPEAVAVLAYRPFADPDLIQRAVASLRLTPLEGRVVLGLLRAGDLAAGAKLAGTGYETARKALKKAMRKAGAARQADLARRLHVAVGGGDIQPAQATMLQAGMGLDSRVAGACVLLALGLTRSEVATTLGVSEHALKDDLATLFQRFGLRSSTDLSRLITEAIVLLGVAANPQFRVGASWSALRPLRFLARPGGVGRIAFSDFGPVSGAPVLLLHSATTGSLLDRGLVRSLQACGMRPLALERPGFGLTDPPDDERADPADAAALDMLSVISALGLRRVRLATRSGEAAAMRLAQMRPDLIERAVLINPFTPYDVDSRWDGFFNGAKRLFVRRPQMIEALARFLAPRLSPQTLERLVRRSLSGSDADTRALARPEVLEDYIQSARLVAVRGAWGFVAEQRQFLTWRPPPLPDGSAWIRLVGDQDVLYRPGDADPVWNAALPGHRLVRRADAGRLIHASHPDVVADLLCP